ncbi:hypothetical protein LH128_01202 [Sphingomonas sp. LH128]|uniref:hypothetical protein n=1 Tax=Sphingomonas sp. LH128 TaxID=473781 RepID=UPI00027CC208|nr:hypothetical protein [Sphingomonas sp. LH128]EJU14950.1 hypothetical protein LH128_01202 [Sphingomonas sp. LH128]
MISFESEPPLGTVVMLDDQAFTLTALVPHTRRDGTATTLLRWRAPCAECGAEFECTSPMATSGLTRRCITHSKAGRPVSGKMRQKVQVSIIEPRGDL